MRTTTTVLAAATAAAALLLSTATPAGATETTGKARGDLLVLSEDGFLSRHDTGFPLLAQHRVKIKLAKGDRAAGLDVRPATKAVYVIGTSGQLYTVDPKSGTATKIGVPIALDGKSVGFDFNPTVDRIRIVTDRGQNLRVHPDTGAIAGTDTPLAYAVGDRAAGSRASVSAAGYTNSVAGATTTGLYGVDTARDTLVTQGSLPGATPVVSPNTGQLFTVGRLGVDLGSLNGFDISPGGRAAAAGKISGLPLSFLLTIDLRTGKVAGKALLLTNPVGVAFTG